MLSDARNRASCTSLYKNLRFPGHNGKTQRFFGREDLGQEYLVRRLTKLRAPIRKLYTKMFLGVSPKWIRECCTPPLSGLQLAKFSPCEGGLTAGPRMEPLTWSWDHSNKIPEPAMAANLRTQRAKEETREQESLHRKLPSRNN